MVISPFIFALRGVQRWRECVPLDVFDSLSLERETRSMEVMMFCYNKPPVGLFITRCLLQK